MWTRNVKSSAEWFATREGEIAVKVCSEHGEDTVYLRYDDLVEMVYKLDGGE